MATPPFPKTLKGGVISRLFQILKAKAMIEIFVELTNQIFWEGYAEQLAKDNPAAFQKELAEFMNTYNS
jgi:hypothetical protein